MKYSYGEIYVYDYTISCKFMKMNLGLKFLYIF